MKSPQLPSVRQRLALPVALPGVIFAGIIGAIGSQPLSAQPPEAKISSSSSATDDSSPSDGSESVISSSAQAGKTARAIGTRAISTITGEGTGSTIAKFTGPNQIGNSVIIENAGNIGIGTGAPASKLTVNSGGAISIQGDNTSTAANAYGLQGRITSSAPGTGSAGLRGINSGTTANGYGVYGSHAGSGFGVYGFSPSGRGVYGLSTSGSGVLGSSDIGYGVLGQHTNATGVKPGVLGKTNSTTDEASGVQGIVTSPSTVGNASAGVLGEIVSTGAYSGAGVRGRHAGHGYGGHFEGVGISSTGVYAAGGFYGSYNYANQPGSTGVYASGGSRGIDGYSEATDASTTAAYGVFGDADAINGGIGVYGRADGATGANYGVKGEAYSVDGAGGHFMNQAAGNYGTGVIGLASGAAASSVPGSYFAGGGEFVGGNGVVGVADRASGYGVVGIQGAGSYAGYFSGNVHVAGALSKSSGTFKIDHPLDPANKYLSHSFVESPDMMNIYNGNVTLDKTGQAIVKMPDYFSALNREFRYQLTCIGGFAPVYVAQEIKSNQFKVAGGKPGMKVSWMVTGVRKDAYANAHRVVAVEEKKGRERGAYLHPELFGQPKEKGIGYAQSPNAPKTTRSKLAQQSTAPQGKR